MVALPISEFDNLEVHLGDMEAETWIKRLEEVVESDSQYGWSRNVEMESRVAPGQMHCFTFQSNRDTKSLPDANLWISSKQGVSYVANILPINQIQLNFVEYNALLKDFYVNVASPVCERQGLRAEYSQTPFDIDAILGKEVAYRLKRFSELANKSTGTSHPEDLRRWSEFLKSVNASGASVVSRDVFYSLRLLGWAEDKAKELSLQFEHDISLIKYLGE